MRRFLCLLLGHDTFVTYTATEGLVQCGRCGQGLDRWRVLRPEEGHREEARRAAFWAKVDQIEPVKLRRVK